MRSVRVTINFDEMDKLDKGLKERGFSFVRQPLFDGEQIYVVYKDGSKYFDAICNKYSIGHNSGLLEVMGDIVDEEAVGDSVEGNLTAEEILRRVDEQR